MYCGLQHDTHVHKEPLGLLALNDMNQKHGACNCTLLGLCGQLETGLGRVNSM